MNQKTGLYFGSFNPIHNGHLIIANFMLEAANLDEVWFIVTPQNPHKNPKNLLNEYDRLHLVELAIADNDRFYCSNIEFRLPRPSYTIDTLTYLKENYPNKDFQIIIGGDSYQNILSWKNAEVLLRNHTILVYNRPGFETKKLDIPSNIHFFDSPALHISATYIRNQIKNKKSIKYLVPEAVEKYLEESGSYQS
ncbi:MAG TPA: nicotinate (nicotinamide) nucleotide adenylyltransferase [Chitinophagaceae bacterium]|nr:nicotinate (nicotinamide) nucleotide adenylyltransferase [Chitinophagaceae bacterium]